MVRAMVVDRLLDLPALDRDHKQIVALLSLLEDALVLDDRVLARNIAATLHAKAAEHFRTEEELFEATGYPGRAKHARAHARTLAQLTGMKHRLDAATPGAELVAEVEAIAEIFARHLLPQDEEFAHFLKGADGRRAG